ncbi:MAG TPA: PD-(D/E)XK nuclease family protein [Candidatus Baltobacteraceae bacterium]|nr:PD-(D/E)XK nuclease family protein [Candidatus Baltobacteraceae bacterium]
MLLVDERRLPYRNAVEPAAFLAPLVGRRVLRDGERRAIVRRIAATREDVTLPAHVRGSASFGVRVVEALDRDAVPPAFETLAAHVRTLTAFADAVDVRTALRLAVGRGVAADGAAVQVDTALLEAEDDAFAWRRLANAAGLGFEPVELGPPSPPPLDLAAVDGVDALLRYVASQSDADARAALLAPQSGVRADDARALLAATGERAGLLETIAKGALPEANRFAHNLAVVSAAYKAPDASATTVLGALFGAFPVADATTRAALERIARDFDAARAFAERWEAADLWAEIAAELAGARPASRAVEGVAPAAPVPDEPAAPVAVRKLSFSASSLNAYAECARKWWFRYVCAAVEDRGSSASFYGIAFHAALEDFHEAHVRFDGVDAEALGRELDGRVVAAFDRHRTRFEAPVEFELQKRRARRTAVKYLAWLLERARRTPFEVIGCETAADVELGGHRFVGYIDRLDRDLGNGTVTVVDYKTGSIATSAAEYLDEVRAFREFQLPFYYWARTAAGDVVTRLALVPLKDALLDVAPVELEVVTTSRSPRSSGATGEIGSDELERARDRMIALAAELSSGTLAAFPATRDPDACRYCAYADACRERPSAIEERFAR